MNQRHFLTFNSVLLFVEYNIKAILR